MAEVYCGSEPCPLFLNSTCVFYTGESLLYIGVQNNDTLEAIIVKINQAFQNAGVGYAFTNGLIQPTPFQPVQLGGALIQNTTIGGNFTLTFSGNVQAARHITTGGSSSQFVKGDGTLDSTAYQPAANYITGLSGDATASGPGVAAMTLATVNFSSGTFGNGNTIPIVTVNAKGLVTNITPVPVTIPPLPLTFIGDVVGSGFTGSNITLLLQNVNPNPYNTITPLKFTVNGKGLVTSASPITASDIVNILGYNPGTSGTSGSAGSSGTSGTTGTSGSSGTSATSGTSGTTGTSGTSATSGTSGTSGTDGTGGTSGTSGSTGTSGTAGTSGTSATSGTSGTSGSSGTAGTSGSTGTSGSSGTTGTSGSSGTTGTSGSSGTSGTTGTSGSSGTSGSTGTSGSSGLSGDRFKTTSTTTYTLQAPGNPGTLTVDPGLAYTVAQSIIIAYDANNHNEAEVTSYNSITGVINFVTFTLTGSGTYSSWFVNIDGASGGDGSSGSSGTSGTSATAGTSGTTGTSGSSGTSGTTGTSGSSGTSGTSATNGTGGTSGTSGSSGTSGTTGTSGTSATSGTSGTSATSGTTGTSGTSGTNGTGGTSGTSGSSATSGTSGTSGVNGAPGAGGTSGTSGTSVAVSGTTNTMAKFTSSTTIGNSALTDNGSTLTYTGSAVTSPTINVNSGNSFVAQSLNNNGGFAMNNSSTHWGLMWNYAANDWRLGYGSTTAQVGWNLRWDNGSTVWANGSFRAPIFYDADDTAYFFDGNSTSRMYQARFQNRISVGDGNGTPYLNTGSPGVWLSFNGGSDQFMGAQSTTVWGAYVVGDWRLTVNSSGTAAATGDMRAPIFYDSNNTAYFIDGASTSDLNALKLNGLYLDRNESAARGINWYSSTFTSWTQYMSPAGTVSCGPTANITAPSGTLVTSWALRSFIEYEAGYGWTFESGQAQGQPSVVAEIRSSDGSAQFNGSVRSPIFFDSNNTAYYLDPSSTSSLRTVGSWRSDSAAWDGEFNGKIQYHANHWYIQAADLLIYRNSGGSNVFTVNQSGTVTATTFSGSLSGNAATATGQQSGVNFTINTGGAGYGLVGVYNPSVYQGLFAMGPAYVLGAGGTLGTLYGLAWTYDSAGYPLNTGYSTQHCLAVVNAGTVYSLIGQGIWTSGLIRANGIISTGSDMRAPIFYDSNDTSYYLNPNSLSYLYSLELSGSAYFRPRTWIQFDGAYGLYWPNNNGAHIYPNTTSSYTQIRLDGSRGSYGGIWDSYSAVHGIMYDSAGNGGVYREASGRWYWYYLLANDCMGIGTSSTSSTYSLYLTKGVFAQSRIDATIYYDSANTGYYLDPSGSSYLAASLEIANGYVLTNGVGGAIYVSSAQGSFGGYVRFAQHAVIESINGGYHIYVLDASGIGVVKYSGNQSWSAYSDGRIKTVHSMMQNNLSKLDGINPVYYSFNNFDDDKNRIGLIAQEVQQYFPELVNTDPKTDNLTLDYTGLIPVLLGAIKELKNKVETLETKI